MRVLVIENYRDTPPGMVGTALAEAGATIDVRHMPACDPLPDGHVDHDALVILGGEQNALDDTGSPWMPALAALSRDFGAADKAVLGICLGAQLVARGYGAENILGRPTEFGWHTVRPTDAGRDDPLIAGLADGGPIFHWHSDTFSIPPEGIHLASSERTDHQAFRVGRAVYGIQFHFEADRRLVERWNAGFADEIIAHTPDWPDRHPVEEKTKGVEADALGLDLARRWVRLI